MPVERQSTKKFGSLENGNRTPADASVGRKTERGGEWGGERVHPCNEPGIGGKGGIGSVLESRVCWGEQSSDPEESPGEGAESGGKKTRPDREHTGGRIT